jgi:uncharacterized protein (TIGR03066 family)
MRFSFPLFLTIILPLSLTSAPEKGEISVERLIGKWVVKDTKPGAVEAAMELTKDGKAKVIADLGGQAIELNGTYTLKGDRLTVTLSFGGQDTPNEYTVMQLTATQLQLMDKKKVVQTLFRAKAER